MEGHFINKDKWSVIALNISIIMVLYVGASNGDIKILCGVE